MGQGTLKSIRSHRIAVTPKAYMLEGMQSNFLILGIIVGLMARGNAYAVPLVAFGIAVLEVGASSMQRSAQVPVEMVLIIEALLLIFLLLSDVVRDRVRGRA